MIVLEDGDVNCEVTVMACAEHTAELTVVVKGADSIEQAEDEARALADSMDLNIGDFEIFETVTRVEGEDTVHRILY